METLSRSCFIEYKNRQDALDALANLMDNSPVSFTVNGIFNMGPGENLSFPFPNDRPVEIYFVLDVPEYEVKSTEDAFIAVAGGEYTGS